MTRLLPVLIALSAPCLAQTADRESLNKFLHDHFDLSLSNFDQGPQYAFVDLNGDGVQEAIVYLRDSDYCGSGGCTMLILTPHGSSYEVVTETTITWPPIRVLNTKSHGWRDIVVWVQGGGIRLGYESELRFDGKTYPSNPSVPPARRLKTKALGEVVIQ